MPMNMPSQHVRPALPSDVSRFSQCFAMGKFLARTVIHSWITKLKTRIKMYQILILTNVADAIKANCWHFDGDNETFELWSGPFVVQ